MRRAKGRQRRHEEAIAQLERDEKEMTPGARRRITALEGRWRTLIKTLIVVGIFFGIGFIVTGWQIDRAFDNQKEERISRIGGQSSINAYFCRKIDDVGKGVAALVTVSLEQSPPPAALPPTQRKAYEQFATYAERQERPPRCRQVARQLALLTGADPDDVKIRPLRLHSARKRTGKSK